MPFTLEFLGAEIGSNWTKLNASGVKDVGFSFHRFINREKSKRYFEGVLSSRLPEDVNIHLYPGIPVGFKDDLETFRAQYEKFISGNIERIASVQEIDEGPAAWIQQQRRGYYSQLEAVIFRPVWRDTDGQAALQALAEQYETVSIPEGAISSDTTLASRTRALGQMYGTSFHALGTARPDNLRSIEFTSASTLAWLAPRLHGETIFWDGHHIIRYPKREKEQARKRLRGAFQRAGFDPDLILADDYTEVVRATIWAYQRMEADVNDRRDRPFTVIEGGEIADNSGESSPTEIAVHPAKRADISPMEPRKLPTPRDPLDRAYLPTLNLTTTTVSEQSDTGPVLRDITVPSLGNSTLRQCNTCYVAAQCPAFTQDSECAFHLPIEVRTREQLRGLLQAIIEMQGQRVAFARFTEELNGGYPDPAVSSEMDRLFKLVDQLKKLEDNREFIRVTAERHSSGGVLSALFGERGKAAQMLPNGGLDVDQTNMIISNSLD